MRRVNGTGQVRQELAYRDRTRETERDLGAVPAQKWHRTADGQRKLRARLFQSARGASDALALHGEPQQSGGVAH